MGTVLRNGKEQIINQDKLFAIAQQGKGRLSLAMKRSAPDVHARSADHAQPSTSVGLISALSMAPELTPQ